jgi:phosphate uptake regulator
MTLSRLFGSGLSIAKRAKRLTGVMSSFDILGMKAFAGDVVSLLCDSCRAFLMGEPEILPIIRSRQQSIEQFYTELNIYLTTRMIAEPSNMPRLLEIVFCAESLKRVSHHALVIALETPGRAPADLFSRYVDQDTKLESGLSFNASVSAPAPNRSTL